MKFFLSFFLTFATIDIHQARVPVSYSSDFHGYSTICEPPLFGCLDGICIPKSWVCDGNDDCLHGEDEYCPLSEISPMEIDEQQLLWKRSPLHEPSWQDLSVYEGAMKLIKESQKDLDRGLNPFSENESKAKTNIRKRNNDNIMVTGSSAEKDIGNNNTESSLTTDLSSSTESFPSASTIMETTELTDSKTDTSFQSSTFTESSATTEEETEITTSTVTTTGIITASEPTSTEEEDSSSSTDFLSSGTTETTETTDGSVSEISTSFLSSTSTDSLTSINPKTEMISSAFTTTEMVTTTESRPTDTYQSEELQILNEKIDMLLEINFQLLETLEMMKNDTLCPTSSYEETTETSSTETPGETTLDNDTIPVISKTTCPYHFQYMNGICIYAQIYPPVTWREAANLCAAQNSHLLYVKSTAFFEKLLKQLNYDRMRVYDFWIGATNLNINGQWIWSDGSFVTNFEVWGFNLRVNKADTFLTYHKPHQCGFLDGNIYSYLNEADCQDPKGFICQFSG